jgi:hypothetical protein
MHSEHTRFVQYGLLFVVVGILAIVGLQSRDYIANLAEEAQQLSIAAARGSQPLTLSTAPLSQSTIRLTWSNANNRSAYSIERSLVSGGQFTEITTTGKGISNYTDTGLTPNTEYAYRVREIIQKGRSISYGSYSNTVSVKTLEPDSIPPTIQITSPTNGQTLVGMISVSTNASDNIGVSRVELWKDDVLVATDTSAPYNFSLDYTLKTSTQVSLLAKAFDVANNVGVSSPVAITMMPDITAQLTANNVLVVYNTNSAQSSDIKDYYVANRPEFANVNVLGVATEDVEITSQATFESTIRQPIVDWLPQNPLKQIYYIVLLRGIPDRLSGGTSVQLSMTTALSDLGIRTGTQYGGSTGATYSPSRYPGTTALVTHLNMGSQEATKAYIDKLKAVYTRMQTPNILISAADAGLGGTNYYLDEAQGYAGWPIIQRDRDGLTGSGGVSSSRIQYTPQTSSTHIATGTDVLGYETWGANGGIGGDYALDGRVTFTGNSNWFLIKTIESYNGHWSTGQGNFVDWFSSNAFGGTNYSNTPVGATTHIEEPYVTGVATFAYLRNWEKGMTFGEAAWDSRSTPYFMAVGDPMVKR